MTQEGERFQSISTFEIELIVKLKAKFAILVQDQEIKHMN